MKSLENCIWLQIKNLISSLTNKKQYKSVCNEIRSIMAAFGPRAEWLVISTVLAEIDWKDPRLSVKENIKLQFLNEQLSNLSEKPQFLDYFSTLVPTADLEEFMDGLIRSLHVSLPLQLILYLSLSLSAQQPVATIGLKVLKSKLAECFELSKPQRIPMYAMHTLLYILKRQKHPDAQSWANFLLESNPIEQEDANQIFIPLLEQPVESHNMALTTKVNHQAVYEANTLAKIMEDIGPSCTGSTQILKELFYLFPKIREKDLAEMLAMMCSNLFTEQNYETRVIFQHFSGFQRSDWNYLNKELPDRTQQIAWNVDVFCEVVKEHCLKVNWDRVVTNLDCPKFQINDENAFLLLTGVYFKLSGNKLPTQPFFKEWTNIKGQVEFLIQAVNSTQNPEVFSFENSPNIILHENIVYQPEVAHKVAAYSSIDLLTILIQLSSTEFHDKIRNLLYAEAKQFPDIILITLSRIRTNKGKKLLKEMQINLMNQYIEPTNTNPLVLQSVWKNNKSLLVMAARNYYMKNPNSISLSHILDITQEVKDSLLTLAGCKYHDFAVHFGLLASKRDFLHLDQWLIDRIANNGEQFVLALLVYIKTYVLTVEAGMNDSSKKEEILERAQFTSESLINIFENLINDPVIEQTMSSETHIEISRVHKELCDLIPEMTPSHSNTEEIEEAANQFFQKVYSGEMSIEETIGMMKLAKESAMHRETEIFSCMVHNLFDEYRFFHKYPENELKITGKLFGAVIENELVIGITLGIALRYVLEALKRPHGKMYRFGWYALRQFKTRLHIWPQYCAQLLQIETLKIEQPEFFASLQDMLVSVPTSLKETPPLVAEKTERAWKVPPAAPAIPAPPVVTPTPPQSFSLETIASFTTTPTPTESTQEKVLFLINNTSMQNIDEKTTELSEILSNEDMINWFSHYLVMKRASVEVNFQPLYIQLLQGLRVRFIFKYVTRDTYKSIRELLKPANIVDQTKRKTLRNLGSWLGAITIGRSKAIYIRDLDLQQQLISSYGTERLQVVVNFVCKILNHCDHSEVFTIKNPWIESILSLLDEISKKVPQEMTKVALEIDILCKNLGVKNLPTTEHIQKITKVAEIKPVEPVRPKPAETNQVANLKIAQMPNYIQLSAKLSELYDADELRQIISLAIEHAIREIISPIIERSVNIALITTRQLCLKDFAVEPDSEKLQKSSLSMVKSLAGSLALVTSREPFRISLCNHLKEFLRRKTQLDPRNVNTIVELASQENLDLGCGVIEKTVKEKASWDIMNDSCIQGEIEKRKTKEFKSELGGVVTALARQLPEGLTPAQQCLSLPQIAVYDGFDTLVRPRKSSMSESVSSRSSFSSQESSMIADTPEAKEMQANQRFNEILDMIESSGSKEAVNALNEIVAVSSNKHELMQRAFARAYLQTSKDKIQAFLALIRTNITRGLINKFIQTSVNTEEVNLHFIRELVKSDIIGIGEFDAALCKMVVPGNANAINFSVKFIRELVIQSMLISPNEVASLINALRNTTPKDKNIDREALSQLLDEVNKITSINNEELRKIKENIEAQFTEWLKMTSNEPYLNSRNIEEYINNHESKKYLIGQKQTKYFFKTICEMAIRKQDYAAIDSFTKFVQVVVNIARIEDRSTLLRSILNSIKYVLVNSYNENGATFNQKPFFRVLVNIITDMNQPNDLYATSEDTLLVIAEELHELNPSRLPGFAFAWLELISHRFFLPKMLRLEDTATMKTIVIDMLKFMRVNVQSNMQNAACSEFYRGVVRVMCVILNDFPEFLCNFHTDLTSEIPSNFIQLRNIILSAHPKSIIVLDPFNTPDLKVDKLPEIELFPTVLSRIKELIDAAGLRTHIVDWIKTKSETHLTEICTKLESNIEEKSIEPLVESVVLQLGDNLINNENQKSGKFMVTLLNKLNHETAYEFLNAVVNQLRYPSVHTKFFSQVVLYIFKKCGSLIQQMITRILMERLLVHKPHPWGNLVTFAELHRNTTYELRQKAFIRGNRAVEEMLERVLKNINANAV